MWIFYYYHYCQSGAVQGNISRSRRDSGSLVGYFNGAKNNNATVFNPRGRRPRPSATSWRPSSSTPPRETATCITVSARLRTFHETLTRPRSDLAFGNRTHMRFSHAQKPEFPSPPVISRARPPARGRWKKLTGGEDGFLSLSSLIWRKNETWRSWRLSSYIFWKAPRLWITPPEDRRHHQASLKSRLKKLTFITRTSLILCDSVPTFERVFALIPSIFKKDVFVAAPLVVCLFCLIFKFKLFFCE